MTQSLHGEMLRYKCNFIDQVLFVKPYYFSKYERILKHAILGQRGHTECIL